jgi:hypothetical protein
MIQRSMHVWVKVICIDILTPAPMHLLWTGLVVCLVLLFIDQKNSKDPYPPSPSDKGPDTIGKTDEEIARDGGIPFAKTQMLNSFLSQQPSDGYLYPKNATGYFRGTHPWLQSWKGPNWVGPLGGTYHARRGVGLGQVNLCGLSHTSH